MTFTEKTFANGQTLPALSLNEMDGNDDHVRDEAAFKMVLTCPAFWVVVPTNSARGAYLQWQVDGVNIGTQGDGAQGDISISGLTAGLHTLELKDSALGTVWMQTRFVKTADLLYLSAWWASGTVITVSEYPTANGAKHFWPIRHITVIGHRTIQTWA